MQNYISFYVEPTMLREYYFKKAIIKPITTNSIEITQKRITIFGSSQFLYLNHKCKGATGNIFFFKNLFPASWIKDDNISITNTPPIIAKAKGLPNTNPIT